LLGKVPHHQADFAIIDGHLAARSKLPLAASLYSLDRIVLLAS
jgi:hypothetical protein